LLNGVLNWVFLLLVAGAVLTAGFAGEMPAVTEAVSTSAKSAVELSIGLAGQMTLWLGLMGVLREAGLMQALARVLRPVMVRLFPEVPPGHPAMGAMVLNLSANILGLNNAATPFGLKAMAELDRLNSHRGVATNAMALFLVINTSGLAVIPTSVVAVRAALGSRDTTGIILPSVVATALSTVAAVLIAKLMERWPAVLPSRSSPPLGSPYEKPLPASAPTSAQGQPEPAPASETLDLAPPLPGPSARGGALAALVGVLLLVALVRSLGSATGLERFRDLVSSWLLPTLVLGILLLGVGRGVRVYEAFIASAKEGFQVSVAIIPYLVAMLVAIGMLRASGALDAITRAIGPVTSALGFPAQALPMALLRPLSGSGALAVMSETMKTHGTDSFVGYLVSLINGSSETTFYVLALYFGSVQVRTVRHTLAACLCADALGIVIATGVCHVYFGSVPLVLPP
jgi:spore maturation protein SpmA